MGGGFGDPANVKMASMDISTLGQIEPTQPIEALVCVVLSSFARANFDSCVCVTAIRARRARFPRRAGAMRSCALHGRHLPLASAGPAGRRQSVPT